MTGEGFAFFHWALTLIARGECKPPLLGWGCISCRGDWNRLQGRTT
jgi:hypothetical protein